MGLYISRQRYHDDNDRLAIEICMLGPKHAGEDILPFRYYGENKNLVSALDACRLAISIYKKWHFNYWDENKWIAIIHPDNTREYFDPEENKDMERLERWAETINAQMTTCCHCKKLMGNRAPYISPDMANMSFCSEHCAATKYHDMYGIESQNITQKGNKAQKAVIFNPATIPANTKPNNKNGTNTSKPKTTKLKGIKKGKPANTKPDPKQDTDNKNHLKTILISEGRINENNE